MSKRGQLAITPRTQADKMKQLNLSAPTETYTGGRNHEFMHQDNDRGKNTQLFQYPETANIDMAKVPDTKPDEPALKVSNIIGDLGPYQIAVILFSALRALSCSMDGLSGPFISPSVKNYQCICDPLSTRYDNNVSISSTGVCTMSLGPNADQQYEIDRSSCHFMSPISSDRIACDKWAFNEPENQRLMNTLTIEQSLVCDREWMKSLSNSMYFVGATFGLLFWGVISDRFGRKNAYVCSHFVTLIFGFSALFADNMTTFIILRAINAFGMIGELIPRSIAVEMVATRYRFICSTVCQIGWAIGIIFVPILSYMNPSYRFILAAPVLMTAVMIPWLIWLPESARWLIINDHYVEAREELIRAARINGVLNDDIDSMIERYNRQVLREVESATCDQESATNDLAEEDIQADPEKRPAKRPRRIGIWRSILAIFTNMHLLRDTVSVFLLLFVAEVVYFSLTLNVADLSGSLYINFFISGVSELISIGFCSVMLANLSRRTCLSVLLLASTVSYLMMALVNVYEDNLAMPLITAVNAFGKLTAIGNLMVIILVSQEVFPTVIRQFGTSLCITVGKAGSAVAPFTHELGQIVGQSYCFGMFSLICLTCAMIPFGLSETGNRELPDTVTDVEEGKNKAARRRKLQKEFLREAKKKGQLSPQNQANGLAVHADAVKVKSETLLVSGNLKNSKAMMGKELDLLPTSMNRTKQSTLEEDPNNNDMESDQLRQTLFISNNNHNDHNQDRSLGTNHIVGNKNYEPQKSNQKSEQTSSNSHPTGGKSDKQVSGSSNSSDSPVGTGSRAGGSSDIAKEQEPPERGVEKINK